MTGSPRFGMSLIPSIRSVMVSLVLFLCLMLAGSAYAGPGPTAEQTAWFEALHQDEVTELKRLWDAHQRTKHWKSVTTIGLVGLQRTTMVQNREPTDALGWNQSVEFGSKVTTWFAIETPKNLDTPKRVYLKYYGPGSTEADIMTMVVVDQASPRWRSWDTRRLTIPGQWEIRVVHEGRVLGTRRLTVNQKTAP